MRVLLEQRRCWKVPPGGGGLHHCVAEARARARVQARQLREVLREVLRPQGRVHAVRGGVAGAGGEPRQAARARRRLMLQQRGDHVDDGEAAEAALEHLCAQRGVGNAQATAARRRLGQAAALE